MIGTHCSPPAQLAGTAVTGCNRRAVAWGACLQAKLGRATNPKGNKVWQRSNKSHAWSAFHWYFLSQDADLPETMIGANPAFWLKKMLANWGGNMAAFTPAAMAEYVRCFSDPAAIHATCEDYRAGRTIDVEIDELDLGRKISCPLLVLWGEKRGIARAHDVLGIWRTRADDVRGRPLACGHFLPEEAPEETARELSTFFGGGQPWGTK